MKKELPAYTLEDFEKELDRRGLIVRKDMVLMYSHLHYASNNERVSSLEEANILFDIAESGFGNFSKGFREGCLEKYMKILGERDKIIPSLHELERTCYHERAWRRRQKFLFDVYKRLEELK